MATNTLELSELWEHVINIGYNVRKTGADGLAAWQPLKKLFTTYKSNPPLIFGERINRILKVGLVYTRIANDPDDEKVKVMIINADKSSIICDNTVESQHFFIQHFRIPIMLMGEEKKETEFSVLKLLQIAYNVGQYSADAENKENTYNPIIKQFYKDNQLNRLSTYIDTRVTYVIRPAPAQNGGSMHNKQKYMMIRNINY